MGLWISYQGGPTENKSVKIIYIVYTTELIRYYSWQVYDPNFLELISLEFFFMF